MGFLEHFRNRSNHQIQGDLFQAPESSDIVIDNTNPTQIAAYRRLHDLLKTRGSIPRTHRVINAMAIQEILSEDPGSLYDALGVPQGKRNRLPTEAQEALMVGNIAAFYEILEDEGVRGHEAIIQAGNRGYRKVRGVFPWNR